MAEEPQENGNRATVALVDAKVDTVLAEVRSGFKDVQRQLDDVAGLPVQVAAMDERLKAVEAARRAWPAYLFSLAALIVSAYAALS